MTTDVVVRSGYLLISIMWFLIHYTHIYTLYAMKYNIILYIINWILYIYNRFIVRLTIVFDFLFITYFLYFFLLWASSLWISSSTISASILYNHVLAGIPTGLLDSIILHTFLHLVLVTFPHHMFIPSQPTTFNDSCDRFNSNQRSQFFTCPSFMETPHIHLIICCIFVFLKYTHSVCWWRVAISAGGLSSACQYQSNLRNLTKDKLLMKHTYTL